MAKKVIYQLIDDIDGTEIAEGEGETVTFGLDGKSYEIDLSDKNATKLRSHLNRYVEAGTKVTKGSKSSNSAGTVSGSGRRSDLTQVRKWAAENGISINDRGRISGEVTSAYDADRAGTLLEDDLRELQQKFAK